MGSINVQSDESTWKIVSFQHFLDFFKQRNTLQAERRALKISHFTGKSKFLNIFSFKFSSLASSIYDINCDWSQHKSTSEWKKVKSAIHFQLFIILSMESFCDQTNWKNYLCVCVCSRKLIWIFTGNYY